jgi:osmotically-inducible protein OsmY
MDKKKDGMTWKAHRVSWVIPVGAIALSLVLTSWRVTAVEEPFGSDAWITAKAKIALITTEDVSAMDVNVDTVDGTVTLHGKVPNEQAKEKAGTVAKKIDGVRDVRNLLQVVKEDTREQIEAEDDAISKGVEKAIDNDTSLKDSDIAVQSVNDGVVLLSGHASSLGDHLEALNVAADVPGVRRVASEITTDNRLYDESIWKEGAVERNGEDAAKAIGDAGDETAEAGRSFGRKAGDAAEAVGSGIADAARSTADASKDAASATGRVVKDAWITSATKAKLVADDQVSAMDVNVDTRDGVVTLFGTVDSMEAKRAAEQDARSVSGVRDVKNEIEIAMDEKRDVK